MKALSVKQPWASLIAYGAKTIEQRAWATDYRGPLPIVSGKLPPLGPAGMALAVVDLVECRPMVRSDRMASMRYYDPSFYSWVLGNIRRIKPFPVKGMLGIFEVDLKGITLYPV